MARPLAGRIARLERARSPGCPLCGGAEGPAAYEVVMPEAIHMLPTSSAALPPRRRGACGRQREFTELIPTARSDCSAGIL